VRLSAFLFQGVPLSCSINDFFDYFLKDDAKYSVPFYQQDVIKDTDVQTSEWEKSEDPFTQTRTISYTHPINTPMAPPSAQAKKTQTLRRYGEHGLCLNTRTDVTGVMYSDCFFVEDRFMVEPSPEGGVILTAKFEMRFVKKTMLKGIMETTSRGEYTDFYKGFANMAVEAIESEKDKSEDPKIDELLVAWRKFRNSSEPSFKETSLEVSLVILFVTCDYAE